MRTIILTSDDPIYMPSYLEPLFRSHHGSILEIINAPSSKKLVKVIQERLQMLGPIAFYRYSLQYMKGILLDNTQRRFRLSFDRYYSVKALANVYNIEYKTAEKINDSAVITHVQNLKPDLILSIGCGQILGKELLEVPTHGAVNVHGSLLPKYRGRATAFWVLYFGEDKSGVTAHYMNEDIDSGDILLQREFAIHDHDTMHDIYEKIVRIGSSVARDILDRFFQLSTKPNEIDQGTCYSLPSAADRRELIRNGRRLL